MGGPVRVHQTGATPPPRPKATATVSRPPGRRYGSRPRRPAQAVQGMPVRISRPLPPHAARLASERAPSLVPALDQPDPRYRRAGTRTALRNSPKRTDRRLRTVQAHTARSSEHHASAGRGKGMPTGGTGHATPPAHATVGALGAAGEALEQQVCGVLAGPGDLGVFSSVTGSQARASAWRGLGAGTRGTMGGAGELVIQMGIPVNRAGM